MVENERFLATFELRWFPSWTGQGTAPESRGGCDGTNDPAVVSKAEGGAAA
jgi:hypothetical protein